MRIHRRSVAIALVALTLLVIGFQGWRRRAAPLPDEATAPHPSPLPARPSASPMAPATAHLPRPADLPAILDSLARQGANEPAAEERQALLRRWASLHPSDAAQWAEQLPDGAVKVESLSHVAIIWTQSDSGRALTWVRTLPPGEGRETALIALGYEAAGTDPTNALLAAGELQLGPARHQLILHTINQWAATDPGAALLWAEQVQAVGLRDELFAAIATAWAEQDPAAASVLAAKAIRPGEPHRRAMVAVLQRWTQTDPAAARSWMQRIADPSLRSNCWEAMKEQP